jgi:hypothetical protein
MRKTAESVRRLPKRQSFFRRAVIIISKAEAAERPQARQRLFGIRDYSAVCAYVDDMRGDPQGRQR